MTLILRSTFYCARRQVYTKQNLEQIQYKALKEGQISYFGSAEKNKTKHLILVKEDYTEQRTTGIRGQFYPPDY